MEIEENIFSKTKRKKTFKIFLDEKNLPFDDAFDHFVFVSVSTARLRRRLLYIIKDDRSEKL